MTPPTAGSPQPFPKPKRSTSPISVHPDRYRIRLFAGALGAALLGAALAPAVAAAATVTLTWTAPGDDGMVGQASSYELRFAETPVVADTAGWWTSATSVGPMPAPLPPGTRESFVVSGLAPGSIYYFVVRTSDEVPNVSGFSDVAVKQAPDSGTVALGTPRGFTASLVPGGVLLTWSGVPAGGSELGYHLDRSTEGSTSMTFLATLPMTALSWTDSTVVGGTSYGFSLATFGTSAEGIPATARIVVPNDILQSDTPVVHGYPNPARDQVTFRLFIDGPAATTPTRINIFDLTGHRICQLVNRVLAPGEHAFPWACRSDGGARVAPGLYNVIADAPSGRTVTRLAIVP